MRAFRSAKELLTNGLLAAVALVVAACGSKGGGGDGASAPKDLAYARNPAVYARHVAIPDNAPTLNGEAANWKVEPALPAGLTLDAKTGVIRGTATVLAPWQEYVVTAKNAKGSASCTLALAVDPPARFALVGSATDATLATFLVDAKSGDLRPQGYALPFADNAQLRDVAAHPSGRWCYALDGFNHSIELVEIDPGNARLTHRASLTTGAEPSAIAVAPDGALVHVLCRIEGSLRSYAVDPLDGRLTDAGSLAIGGLPQALTISRDGRFAFVAMTGVNRLQAIAFDAATGMPARTGAALPTGSMPVALACDPTARFVYAVNLRGDSLSAFAIDAASGELSTLGTLPAGHFPSDAIVDPTGRRLYVTSSGDDTVRSFAIDEHGDLTPVAAMPQQGVRPVAVGLDTTGEHLFVLDIDGQAARVLDVDLATGHFGAPRERRTRESPALLALVPGEKPATPRAQYAYTANVGSQDVSMYSANPDSGVLTDLVPSLAASGSPQFVVADPFGRFVFSGHSSSNDAHSFRIDPDGVLRETGTAVPLPSAPRAGIVEPSGRFLHVVSHAGDTLHTLAIAPDDGALTAIAVQPTDDGPIAIASDPTGRFLYVANYFGNTLAYLRLDPATGLATPSGASIAVTGRPRSLVVHPNGRYLYVAFEESSLAARFALDPIDGSPSGAIAQDTGVLPTSITLDPTGRFAYTANRGPSQPGDISHFTIADDTGNLTLFGSVTGAIAPVAVLCDPAGRFLYAVNQGANSVSLWAIDQQTGMPKAGPLVQSGVAPVGMAMIGILN